MPEYRTQKYLRQFPRLWRRARRSTPAPLYRLPFGQVFFRGVSTGAIGALQGMLDAYLDYGKKRIGRASGTPASEEAIVQLTCAEVAVAIDEMKTILHRNFRELERYAAKGEMPPLKQRVEYKFHNAVVAERCSLLASRLFKAAGTAGIAADLPFGRILSDITVGRQHISNQFEAGRQKLRRVPVRHREQQGLCAVERSVIPGRREARAARNPRLAPGSP